MRVWRQNTGVAVPLSSVRKAMNALRAGNYSLAYTILAQARPIKFGVNGQADITGLLADGRRLEVEVKGKGGRQSDAQKAFQGIIERMGGVYVLARCVDDVERTLQ